MSDRTDLIYDNKINFSKNVGGDANNILKSKDYMKNQINFIKKSKNNQDVFVEDDALDDALDDENNKQLNTTYDNTDNNTNKRYNLYSGYLQDNGLSDNNSHKNKHVFFININSAFRNKEPSIILSDATKLQKNPVKLFHDSNKVFVYFSNHGYTNGDLISLKNVTNKVTTLKTYVGAVRAIDFVQNSRYGIIRFKHGIAEKYTDTDLTIEISDVVGGVDSSYLSNIPLNAINKVHNILLTKPIETNVQAEVYNSEKLYFELPTEFADVYVPKQYNFKIKISALGGVSVSYLNASFPIDTNHKQGYFSVCDTTIDGFHILIGKRAFIDTNTKTGVENNINYLLSGGSNVLVSKVDHVLAGYADPNKYKISLGKTYHNINVVKLISTEFPNSKQVVRDYPEESRNNRIYWQNINDGDHVYSIEIAPGNYGPSGLIDELQAKFYATQKIELVGNQNIVTSYTRNHYIRVSINTNTNIVEFRSYKEAILIKPFTNLNPDIDENGNEDTFSGTEEFEVTLTHTNHGLKAADKILIQKAITHMGIPSSVLNIEHTITEIVDSNSYKIILPKFNLSSSGRKNTKGGVSVHVYVPDLMRLRFDYTDTLGNILGFRNAGHPNSITTYSDLITNKDPYEIDTINSSVSLKNNFVNLGGDNYFFMVITQQHINTMFSNGPVKEAFAKILLVDAPGKVMYNTHISEEKRFTEPISLDELEFEFYSPDGTFFDFSGLDHSFTLRLESVTEVPYGTQISSKTGRITL